MVIHRQGHRGPGSIHRFPWSPQDVGRGGGGPGTPCSSTAREAKILAPFIMVPLLSHLTWAGVRGAWYRVDLWETLRFPLEGEGHGVRAGDHRRGLLLGARHREAMDGPNSKGAGRPIMYSP